MIVEPQGNSRSSNGVIYSDAVPDNAVSIVEPVRLSIEAEKRTQNVFQNQRLFTVLATILMVAIGGLLAGSPKTSAAQSLCGNGVLDPGEACDDHNTRDDDCCSSACSLVDCTALAESLVSWSELGPFSVGGRVTALAVDPRDSSHLVVGSPAGGIWTSDDGAESWQVLTPWLAVTPISALAIHPDDSRIIVAGTGSISDGGSVGAGIGIIRSTDGGTSWFQVTSGQVVPYVTSVLFWDEEPSRVLAATDLGVLVSLDGGGSFSWSLQGQAVSVFARDPFDPDTVYATSRSGLFVSNTRGDAWTRVSSWPLLETDTQGAGTTGLAVSRQTPGLVYATVQVFASFSETDRALLLRSTDGGSTFEELPLPDALCPSSDSCGYGLSMAVDPMDDRRLLLGGDSLFASSNSGVSWDEVEAEIAKVHELALHANGAYAAGASGVSVINREWDNGTAQNNGLAITSIVSLDASSEAESRLLGGTADTGTIMGIGEPLAWTVVFGEREPAGTARFDPFDEDRLYVAKPNGRFYRSDDSGETFAAIQQGLDLAQSSTPVTPFEPSPLVPDTLFTGLLQPFQSTDAGESWQVFRPEGFPEVSRMVASAVDSDRVYFSLSSDATLFKADDIHTETYVVTDEPNHRITSIFLDPGAENILYATLTNTASHKGRVFKSWDFGAHWQDITPPGLPGTTSFTKDPYGALYVGSAEGVWRSANDGFSWARFHNGLLGSDVSTLRLGQDRIFAGTSGRGVYSVPVLGLTSIESIPDGQLFWVDGELVRAPHFVLWDPGSVHTVEPYLLQTGVSRQVFGSWSDGGTLNNEVVTATGTSAVTAAIRNLFRLDLTASPSNGGSVVIEPPTADRFFLENTVVSWVAVPRNDHRFAGYTGDLSGGQDGFGFAVMDRPRTVVAEFEPLTMTIGTVPSGFEVAVDGERTSTPRSFNWSVDTVHTLRADEFIDSDPGDPALLAFDGWTDLFGLEHTLTVRRDTFITSLDAKYITIIPELDIPRGGSRLVRTEGVRPAPRMATLAVGAGGSNSPAALQFVRGTMEGELITEVALTPSDQRLESHSFVEGGSAFGKTRIIVHNPGVEEATVDLLLRDESGSGLVARNDVFRVPPGGRRWGFLIELIALDDPYDGLLSILSDEPVVVSVQSVRGNLRPTTFVDPILVVSPLEADHGVPASPRVQTLLLTPNTEHRLVLSNPGPASISGSLKIHDEAGHPLDLADAFPSVLSYQIPSGGYEVLRFRAAGLGATGIPPTGRVILSPSGNGVAPLVQLVEEQTVGESMVGPIVLPRSIPPSQGCTGSVIPVDLSRRDSGLILGNRSTSGSASVDMSLIDSDGSEIATTTVSVPAGGQVLALVSEIFPTTGDDFQGVVTSSCGAETDAVGVVRQVNGRGEQILAGFPALDAASGGAASVFPFAVDGDSWSSEWWQIGWWLDGPATSTFTFFGDEGEIIHLPMEW